MYDDLIIGAGFFGCQLAIHRQRQGRRVLLVESGEGLLGRASRNNQARVHGGYHYPRSFLTGRRSQVNYQRFVREFAYACDNTRHLYAIARNFSAVSSEGFERFCAQIKAPCREYKEQALFEPSLIESVFEVEEKCFNADRLREAMEEGLKGVEVLFGATAERVTDELSLEIERGGERSTVKGRALFIAAYAQTNAFLARSRLPLVPLQQELAEMALVQAPAALRGFNITVMDGPFWSLMHYPTTPYHTLSHVRYTPRLRWFEETAVPAPPAPSDKTHFPYMKNDAKRMLPALEQLEYVDSVWETKTVLPRSQENDSRPIFFARDHGRRGVHVIIGGKIDNVFDLLGVLD